MILLGDTPGQLVESNLITDLNPPNRVADTSRIHAGKAAWHWWNGDLGPDGQSAYTTKNMEYYVDFAAESGFPYMMLDAGWSDRDITKMRRNVDVPELVQYAAKKNVKIVCEAPIRSSFTWRVAAVAPSDLCRPTMTQLTDYKTATLESLLTKSGRLLRRMICGAKR